MKEKIEKFLEEKKLLTEKLKLWVVDKSIPLGERWDLFIKSELGIEEPYIIDFDCEMGKQYIEELEYKYSTHNTGNIVKFPDSLELLSIDGKFNQQLIGLETTNIETLEISGDFNNSIDYLPRKLKSLVIRGHDFSFPVVNSRRPLLPETIETIYIDSPKYREIKI